VVALYGSTKILRREFILFDNAVFNVLANGDYSLGIAACIVDPKVKRLRTVANNARQSDIYLIVRQRTFVIIVPKCGRLLCCESYARL